VLGISKERKGFTELLRSYPEYQGDFLNVQKSGTRALPYVLQDRWVKHGQQRNQSPRGCRYEATITRRGVTKKKQLVTEQDICFFCDTG
jgi:hypothetical protein